MYQRIALVVFTLSISVYSRAQQGYEQRWTDKNNAEEYAAYVIQIAYNERGYISAKVEVKQSAEEDVFVVNPGPVFHFKDIRVVGLPENVARQMMNSAPKTGEVYSQARINDWLAEGSKQLAAASIVQKFAGQKVRMDRAAATAIVTVLYK
jgi:outer membrane protein assembly factor BamA